MAEKANNPALDTHLAKRTAAEQERKVNYAKIKQFRSLTCTWSDVASPARLDCHSIVRDNQTGWSIVCTRTTVGDVLIRRIERTDGRWDLSNVLKYMRDVGPGFDTSEAPLWLLEDQDNWHEAAELVGSEIYGPPICMTTLAAIEAGFEMSITKIGDAVRAGELGYVLKRELMNLGDHRRAGGFDRGADLTAVVEISNLDALGVALCCFGQHLVGRA